MADDKTTTRLFSYPELYPHPLIETDLNCSVTYMNPSAKRFFPDLKETGSQHPYLKDLSSVISLFRKNTTDSFFREIAIDDIWFEQSIYYVRSDHRVRIFGADITVRKKHEDILQTRVRLGELAASFTEPELLRAALDETERLTGSSIGFFHYVDDDQLHLSLQMWSTNTLKNMCTAEGADSHYPIDKAGVWIDCVHKKMPVIHNDYAALPDKKGLPPGHAPVIRELVVPVMQDGKVVAVVGVGNKKNDYDSIDLEAVSVFANMMWDVILRRRAEEGLRTAALEWQATFDAVNDAVWLLDRDHHIKQSNKAAERLFALSKDEMIGRYCCEIVHNSAAPIPECPVLRMRESMHRESLELRLGERWFEVIVDPVIDAEGNYAGAVHIVADITSRRQEEQARRDTVAELEKALAKVRQLSGLLPICCSCKKIRDDKGYWQQIETYLKKHSEAEFSHGICPDCMKKLYPDDEDRGKH